ncbi:MAG: ATP-grasp domain-containing protein, partial [Gammaproteobacteria bacterium]
MNIHEYQAKLLLSEFQVPVARGSVAFSPQEAAEAAQSMGGSVWVVKSQIHAGGRGKGRFKEAGAGDKGGVRLVKSVDEVRESAEQMLGKTLVTHQTGPDGKTVKRVYVEEGSS